MQSGRPPLVPYSCPQTCWGGQGAQLTSCSSDASSLALDSESLNLLTGFTAPSLQTLTGVQGALSDQNTRTLQ